MTLDPSDVPNKVESGSSDAASPARWLLVIVPAIVLLLTVANLLGLWSLPMQQAARDAWLKQQEEHSAEGEQGASAPSAETTPNSIDEPVVVRPATPADDVDTFDASTVVAMIGDANIEKGAQTFRMCGACHTAEKNAVHRVGPNLWDVVGHDKAARKGFAYSQVLGARGGVWTYEDLALFLHNPRGFAPGTKMAFAGISDNAKIANLIAYLRTLSDDPVPLPAE